MQNLAFDFDTPATSAPAVAPAIVAKLDDYGEKLGGAKKDHFAFLKEMGTLAQRQAHAQRLANLESRHLTDDFYKIYKKPTLKQLFALSCPTDVKAFLHLAYTAIGKKPTSRNWRAYAITHAQYLAKYVTAYHALKHHNADENQKLLAFVETVEKLKGLAVSSLQMPSFELFYAYRNRSYVGVDERFNQMMIFSALLSSIDENLWQFISFEYAQTLTTYQSGLASEHYHFRFYFNKNRQTITVNLDATFGELIYAFAERIKVLAPTTPSPSTKADTAPTLPPVSLYKVRHDGLYFIICKKDPTKTHLFETYDKETAFDVYHNAHTNPQHHELLMQAWQKVLDKRFTLNDLHPKNDGVRQAPSHRPSDCTPQAFAETFGVRGVEFGNWVKQGKEHHARQDFINKSFDAFADLAMLLGVDKKAIGLNQSLGFAMGSRGSGSASAHYEADTVVINLTKTRGNGSVAHEWLHAYDHAQAMKHGLPQTFYSQSVLSELMQIPSFKAMADRANNLDILMGKQYYRTAQEMTARYFESVMLYKLQKMGYVNDFLVKYLWREGLADCDTYPYVLPAECDEQEFNQFFDIMGLDGAKF